MTSIPFKVLIRPSPSPAKPDCRLINHRHPPPSPRALKACVSTSNRARLTHASQVPPSPAQPCPGSLAFSRTWFADRHALLHPRLFPLSLLYCYCQWGRCGETPPKTRDLRSLCGMLILYSVVSGDFLGAGFHSEKKRVEGGSRTYATTKDFKKYCGMICYAFRTWASITEIPILSPNEN